MGTTHDFIIDLKWSDPTLFDFKLIMTGGRKSVVFFERYLGNLSYVYFTKVATNGDFESQGYIKHPDIANYSRHSEKRMPSPPVNGCVELWSYIRHLRSPLIDSPDAWLLLRIILDSAQDR